MSRNFKIIFYLGAFILSWDFSCRSKEEDLSPESDEELSGGRRGTVYDSTFNAFGNSFQDLTSDEVNRFVNGNSFNRNSWVVAPSSTPARDGLGPLLNASACASCHILDGKGSPFNSQGQLSQSILFRLSVPGAGTHGEPLPDPNYGGQFNPRSIPGVDAEGDVTVSYTELPGTYPDGTSYSLRKPTYLFSNLNYGPMTGTLISPRTAPNMIGVGLLDAISEAAILANADPNDGNGDGISGKANFVWNQKKQQKVIGKFGWKANEPTAEQQTAGAFRGDIGITSSIFQKEDLTEFQFSNYGDLPNGGDPELEEKTLQDVVFYIRTLAVPARRNWQDTEVLKGKELFTKANCSGCHAPKMLTGSDVEPVYLANQTIRPYTDLLLHDMGEGLADHRPDFEASGTEWRTAPLWGTGLQYKVNKHTFMLHDGRARNVEEAILWHGGEAEKAKKAFMNYSRIERSQLLKFIDSL